MYALLQLGSSGEPVKTLQTQLKAVLNLGSSFPVNGQFDEQTQAAVKSFQQQYHLTVDGTAGAKTCAELDRLYVQVAGTSSAAGMADSTGSQTTPQTTSTSDLTLLVRQLEQAIETQVTDAQSKVTALEQRAAQLQKAISEALQILDGGTKG